MLSLNKIFSWEKKPEAMIYTSEKDIQEFLELNEFDVAKLREKILKDDGRVSIYMHPHYSRGSSDEQKHASGFASFNDKVSTVLINKNSPVLFIFESGEEISIPNYLQAKEEVSIVKIKTYRNAGIPFFSNLNFPIDPFPNGTSVEQEKQSYRNFDSICKSLGIKEFECSGMYIGKTTNGKIGTGCLGTFVSQMNSRGYVMKISNNCLSENRTESETGKYLQSTPIQVLPTNKL